jgi:hypothetical protein
LKLFQRSLSDASSSVHSLPFSSLLRKAKPPRLRRAYLIGS